MSLSILVSAPSGCGKTSLIQALANKTSAIEDVITHTTRSPRPGEENGVDYHFVSMEVFEAGLQRGEFLESAEIYGNRYGSSRAEVERIQAAGHIPVLNLDFQGLQQLQASDLDIVSIFILPPSLEELRNRLTGRGAGGEQDIQNRISQAEAEMANAAEYDYQVVNDDFDAAVEELGQIIRREAESRRV